LQRLERREELLPNSSTKPFFPLATKILLLVNAHRIEPTRSGNVTADDELLLQVRASILQLVCLLRRRKSAAESLPFFRVAIPNGNTNGCATVAKSVAAL
jgi:hypothetical protein